MNFSQREVRKRARQLQSPANHRLHKLQLICLRILLVGFILGVCFGASALFGAFRGMVSSAPDIQSIQVVPQGYTTTILDTKGNSIQTLVGRDANREYVTLEQIPINLQNAFVAIEDERFWTHNGIDIQGILRAGAVGITNGGDFSQGASTLTQQLLKNQVFGGGEEKTLYDRVQRKLQEQVLAVQLETKFTKDQILEYYLNTINLGQNTLGVQAASKRYFNKDVSELTLSECAVLAAITQNPSAYNPISHPNKNQSRRTTVLTYMKEQGFITSEEYTAAMQDDVYSRIQTVNRETVQTSQATSYFTDALIDQVIQDLKAKLGYTETQAYNALYTGGLTIYSTQNTALQKICDTVINDKKYYPSDSKYQLTYQLSVKKADGSEKNYDFRSMKSWFNKQKSQKISQYYTRKADAKKLIKTYKNAMVQKGDTVIAESVYLIIQPQVSFVLMDQDTGRVKALCGGRGPKTGSRTLNRATNSARQPGSTFKVLSTYLPALDTAGMTLATVQDDAEYYYPGTKRLVKNWYGSSYRGLTSLRTAIADSMNVVAVKTLEQVTPKIGYDYLLNLNFTTLVDNYTDSSGETYTDIALPMALGGLTKGVTNLELTTGFASIAGGGVYHRATFYTKIVDHDGNVLLENKPKQTAKQVMKDSTAWLLTSAMQDVISKGTGTQLKFRESNMPQAGKTGTSTSNRDLWFVGYTPHLTAGIWGGYDASDKQTSTSYHKEIWRTIMERVNRRHKQKSFQRPKSITSAVICTKCGKLAIDDICANAVGGSCVKQEYFAKDSVPTENCDCHVRCRICKSSGHLAGDNCPSSQIYTAVYLQQKASGAIDKTADAPLIIPGYLSNSLCEVHN
ncbi:MAG: transglycosylase domain-containing protein [Lachnospiraceae bacterium]|nr:transglycosylase domain-containing protein [Lachnospiraceae bacterium]